MTLLSFLALALVIYTYAGYPILIALWARLFPRPVTGSAGFEPRVSVCMAVHNGAEHLLAKLRSLQALDYPHDKLDFLVYCDGSTDATLQLLREFASTEPRVKILSCEARRGKPNALNGLRAQATSDVLVLTDVRQTIEPHALRALLAPLADPEIGCVSGRLVLSGGGGASAYWRYESFIRDAEARLGSMLGVSGSLYALRREDLQELPEQLLLDDMFIPLGLVRRRKRIVVSRQAEAHDQACTDEREFSRKVRTLAGNYQLLALMPWLLVPSKNPVWFQLVSHKLLRLLCPWALLLLLGSSLALASTTALTSVELAFWRTVAVGQIVFYALAACGARAGRLAALARTFVVLNAAALVGLWRFLRGSQAVTW